MAVAQYEVPVPFGVVEHNGVDVTGLREKPVLSQFINAGIYIVEPRVQKFLVHDRVFNMTDLVESLLAHRERVVVFSPGEGILDRCGPARGL